MCCYTQFASSESMLAALDLFHGKDLKTMGKRSIELEEPWNI